MDRRDVAIIGSGIAATAIAWTLVKQGHRVTLFEKGPFGVDPPVRQFQELFRYGYRDPAHEAPRDLKALTVSGEYRHDLNDERVMAVGGSATRWAAISLRMRPEDFRTRTLYDFGNDWPLTYDEIEPYYCRAETLLGVSGDDAGNPFAPPRSRPYPLPPFEPGHADLALSERLGRCGIRLHTTPQARARVDYDGRPACENIGLCTLCPTGARYTPNHHLERLGATGRCTVIANAAVRRIVTDRAGRAEAIVYRPNDEMCDIEHGANVVILAAGGIESPRLLLLSADDHHPNGLGNNSGQVGANFTMHHSWSGVLNYPEPVYGGRIGAVTTQCHQFRDPPGRGRHGGVRIDLSSNFLGDLPSTRGSRSGAEIVERMRSLPFRRGLIFEAESVPDPGKRVTLSNASDRFGDRLAHVQYAANDFDHRTYGFVCELFDRLAEASGGEKAALKRADEFHSGWHHMSACRMGEDPRTSVVDSYGRVHGVSNLYVAGAGTFAGTSGAVSPTLTIVALALRTADVIANQIHTTKINSGPFAIGRSSK
jgi:choline dehydrogenase-like flavoprotein